MLEQCGYLVVDNDYYWFLLKLFELVYYYQLICLLVSIVLFYMCELVNCFMQFIYLMVYEVGCVIVVVQVDSFECWVFGFKVGVLVSLIDIVFGYVLLVFCDDVECVSMLVVYVCMDGEQEIERVQLMCQIKDMCICGYLCMESWQICGVINLFYLVMGVNNCMLVVLNVFYIECIDKKVNFSLDEV